MKSSRCADNPLPLVESIACILVLYHPSSRVIDTIKMLSDEGYEVRVVINAATKGVAQEISQISRVVSTINSINLGLGEALNQGVASAFECVTTEFVILFDQDSLPNRELPKQLVAELMSLRSGQNACIGPHLRDEKAPHLPYTISCAQMGGPSEALTLPTSGTVIPKHVYEQVGPMNAAFFIDGIDHEWCFRASAQGVRVLKSSRHEMIHNMGDAAINWFGGFKPCHQSPLRHYYIVRNHLYLVLNGPAPWHWRLLEVLKLTRRIVAYPFLSSAPMVSICLIGWGILDGARGSLGICRRLNPSSAGYDVTNP